MKAQIFMTVSTNEKMQNLFKCKNAKGQKGSRGGHVTQFLDFWDPLISRGCMMLEISNLAQRWTAVSTNEKMQN